MKRKTDLLIAAALFFAASGILVAADFETDIKNVGNGLADYKSGKAAEFIAQTPVPLDTSGLNGTKWYSVTFFGNTHKYVGKAAMKFINKSVFPDLGAAKDILIDGCADETGHPDPKANGGRPEDLWYGVKPETLGGVLQNYTQFKFNEAYARLGTIAHLTQDQAVPTHAANIKHYIGDSFEGFYGNDVKIASRRSNEDREPYAYYQELQDETRRKLPGWTDPKTGRQYWVEAPDAPPLGQDATYGPRGHYGGKHDWDMYAVPPPQDNSNGNNNNTWITAHPEIRLLQMAEAGAATISVFESASKRLPPLVQNLSVSTAAFDSPEGTRVGYNIKFNAYDNRSPRVAVEVIVYTEGGSIGTASSGVATLAAPPKDGIMFSGALTVPWAGVVDFRALPAGKYFLDVRLTDDDGNTVPESVNTDGIRENDTRVEVTIPETGNFAPAPPETTPVARRY